MVTGTTPRGRRRGVAADELRRHNLAAVLERVHLTGPVSRSELTARTGLNRSTIAHLVAELTELGLVEEGPAEVITGPGRPSPVVRARPQGAVVLAVELAVDSVAVGTMGLGGWVYNRLHVARPRGRFSPEETVQDVARLAGPLLASLPVSRVLAGVGVGVVGVVRRSDGFVHVAPNLGWRDVSLAALLADELGLGVPVSVANEADLGALGEHRRGPHGAGNILYVSGEVGIGTGTIAGGEPLLGAAGYAGEAGHMLVNPGGRVCRCGAHGCWETEAGEEALLRRARLERVANPVDVLVERATAGDGITLVALTETAWWLGVGIGNLVNLLNPEVVVLGGLYERLHPWLAEPLQESVGGRALAPHRDQVRVVPSALGEDAVLHGAAELVLSQVVADPALAMQEIRTDG